MGFSINSHSRQFLYVSLMVFFKNMWCFKLIPVDQFCRNGCCCFSGCINCTEHTTPCLYISFLADIWLFLFVFCAQNVWDMHIWPPISHVKILHLKIELLFGVIGRTSSYSRFTLSCQIIVNNEDGPTLSQLC